MRIAMFYHSLVSDWNHGNAHFVRGIVQELLDRDHEVDVFEPRDGWSRTNLVRDHGREAIDAFHRAYPRLRSRTYDTSSFDPDDVLRGVDLVLVHEWNDHDLVARVGAHRAARGRYVLLFHDTHHRSVTDPASMAAYDLRHYDGVLAFGDAIRDLYLERGWIERAWTWHEAADARVFYPRRKATAETAGNSSSAASPPESSAVTAVSAVNRDAAGGDVVWIGNWGDEERTAEIDEFFLQPVKRLGLRAAAYGVRYPEAARAHLASCGVEYCGWLPNADVPSVFARYAATVHIPRRPYLEALPGVPTIRVFEALACGIPLISARWDRTADLFTPDEDFLVARDGDEMTAHLRVLVSDEGTRKRLATRGLGTIAARHTCAHRVDELLKIYDEVRLKPDTTETSPCVRLESDRHSGTVRLQPDHTGARDVQPDRPAVRML
jgi:spore maturation protein CgeB